MEKNLSDINEIKKNEELNFWTCMVNNLAKYGKTPDEKEKLLLDVCYNITYPRYKEDLYLYDDSFKGQRILDIGCGPHGGIIGFNNCEKFGADHLINSYKKIGYPLDKHPIQYFEAKSEQLPFEDKFFDAVICVNALDHVDDLEKTIFEMSRVLKTNGKFLGQINFHKNSTSTEPYILSHPELIEIFSRNSFQLKKVIYQYYLEEADENRYYYELEKMSNI